MARTWRFQGSRIWVEREPGTLTYNVQYNTYDPEFKVRRLGWIAPAGDSYNEKTGKWVKGRGFYACGSDAKFPTLKAAAEFMALRALADEAVGATPVAATPEPEPYDSSYVSWGSGFAVVVRTSQSAGMFRDNGLPGMAQAEAANAGTMRPLPDVNGLLVWAPLLALPEKCPTREGAGPGRIGGKSRYSYDECYRWADGTQRGGQGYYQVSYRNDPLGPVYYHRCQALSPLHAVRLCLSSGDHDCYFDRAPVQVWNPVELGALITQREHERAQRQRERWIQAQDERIAGYKAELANLVSLAQFTKSATEEIEMAKRIGYAANALQHAAEEWVRVLAEPVCTREDNEDCPECYPDGPEPDTDDGRDWDAEVDAYIYRDGPEWDNPHMGDYERYDAAGYAALGGL